MAMDGINCPIASVCGPSNSAIICFSSLRWPEAHRLRPLLARFARQRQVFFLEEPEVSAGERLRVSPCAATGVQVVTPMLPANGTDHRRAVLDLLLARSGPAIGWYAAPEAVTYSRHVSWLATVYDCTETPSAWGLPFERHLIEAADLVFTGSSVLHDALRAAHPHIHCFPVCIDVEHFATARGLIAEPDDQIGLRRPLLGRYGAVDDRLDLDLLARLAALRPHWQFALIGAIETARDLPRARNIHWLGDRSEAELPAYLSHWDVAIMPMAPDAVSDPAEAPRYLAAGRRVVTTPLKGTARSVTALEAVAVATSAEAFLHAAEEAMCRADVSDFVAVDDLLATLSCDAVQRDMAALLSAAELSQAPASYFGLGANPLPLGGRKLSA